METQPAVDLCMSMHMHICIKERHVHRSRARAQAEADGRPKRLRDPKETPTSADPNDPNESADPEVVSGYSPLLVLMCSNTVMLNDVQQR